MIRAVSKRLVVLALLLLAACKHDEPKPEPPACRDDLPRLDVMRLQQLARSGDNPCPDLPTPKIVLDSRGVSVDGAVVVAPQDLPRGRPQNITSLFQSFEGRRRLWRELHPGETFAPKVTFTAEPGADAVAGASVIRSVAWSGFTKIHLVAGDATVDFDSPTPRPPGAPEDKDIVRLHTTGTMHDLAQDVATAVAAGKHEFSFERGS